MTPRWPSSSGTFEANAAAVSRDEIDQPTVIDLLSNCHQFWVGLRSGLSERLGHEGDGLHVGAAVEDHPSGHAIVVVVGETCIQTRSGPGSGSWDGRGIRCRPTWH